MSLTDEFELKLGVVFVPSDRNKADALTRVRKRWLKAEEDTTAVCCVGQEEVKELHDLHHVGVDRMLYLIQKVNPDVTREAVQSVVRSCNVASQSTPRQAFTNRERSKWTPIGLDWPSM